MNRKILSMLAAASTAAMVSSASILASVDEHQTAEQKQAEAAYESGNQKPLSQFADEASVTLTGTVAEVGSDEFKLQTNTDLITVEVDDVFKDDNAYTLVVGDKVTVSGVIDDDLFEAREIEANAVYVDKLDITFVAGDEYAETYGVKTNRDMSDMVELNGRIVSIDGDEFTIVAGTGQMIVDVDELENNPLDDEGYLKLKVGDRVRVSGEIDEGWFEQRELKAHTISVIR